MKVRSSTKFVVSTLAVAGAVFFGWKAYSNYVVGSYKPTPIQPGRVNLVAVLPAAGYRIIVSNGIAHLVEVRKEDLDSPDWSSSDADAEETRNAARLPIRDMLKALQGDAKAMGVLAMSVNKLSEDALPPGAEVWAAERIQRALDTPGPDRTALESTLHVTLDGTPLETLQISRLMDGIVVESPVPVRVRVGGEERTVTGYVREPYMAGLATAVENRLREKFNPTRETLVGIYREEARKLLAPDARREDVRRSLETRISPQRLAGFAAAPERILANTQVVINEAHLAGSSFKAREAADGSKSYDLTLRLSPDGRMRLWKYSHDNPGFQLLLTVDGVAIAAPRISTELVEPQVTLTQVRSETLVQDATDLIQSLTQGNAQK